MNTQDRDRARSYAEALYEATFERWLLVLDAAADALSSDERLLDRVPAGQMEFGARKALLDDAMPADVDLPVRNLLYSLAQRGDLPLLGEIAAALRVRLTRVAEAATRVEVVSAVPLTEEERTMLASKLASQYGAGLEFTYRVDPEILGGLVVRIGDKLIDGSVASKLAAMKHALGVTGD
jgi:F-type H+-transporting ATPase subunit delta